MCCGHACCLVICGRFATAWWCLWIGGAVGLVVSVGTWYDGLGILFVTL